MSTEISDDIVSHIAKKINSLVNMYYKDRMSARVELNDYFSNLLAENKMGDCGIFLTLMICTDPKEFLVDVLWATRTITKLPERECLYDRCFDRLSCSGVDLNWLVRMGRVNVDEPDPEALLGGG